MEKLKVLLVDDEEDFVKTLAERVSMRDIEARVALAGEEALGMLEGDIPDVMVLDLKMPGIGGMEVLSKVRRTHPRVRVIILTGHGTERDGEEARRLGAFEVLQKPVDVEMLVRTMKAACEKKLDEP